MRAFLLGFEHRHGRFQHVAGDPRSASDVDALRALTLALQASLATTETALATTDALSATTAELRAAKASIQLTALEIAKLKAQIALSRPAASEAHSNACPAGRLINA